LASSDARKKTESQETASSEFAEYRWIEFSHTTRREIPPLMITLEQLDEMKTKYQREDCYTSIFRCSEKDPNVGSLLSGFPLDFDDKENPERARKEACRAVAYLMDRLGIPEQSISICFTGSKGFAIFVNRRAFGIQPSERLPLILKSMAMELKENLSLKTLDLKVYHRRALWRLPDTQHPKSSLFKVEMTNEELEKFSIDEIKDLARKPRAIKRVADHKLVPEAQHWYLKHVKLIDQWFEDKKERFISADLSNLPTVPCVAKRLQVGSEEGNRNNTVFQLAIYFARSGKSIDETRKMLLDFNQRNKPPLLESEVLRSVESANKGVKEDRYSVGCGSEAFHEFCNKEHCPFFAKIAVKAEPIGGILAEQRETVLSEEVKTEAVQRLREEPIEYVIEIGNRLHKGDQALLKLDWLSALSPELSQQLHLMSVGKTGKGKTHHSETALEFIPRDRVIYVNDPSPKSFYYAAKAGVKFDKCVLLIDDATEDHIPILKSLTSQNRLKPRAWSVDEQQFIDLNIEGDLVVWCSSVSPIRDEQGQLTRRFLVVNPMESEELDQQVAKFTIQRMRHGLSRKEVPHEFEVVKCMTKILKEHACRVIIPFEFDFPVDPQRTLHGFFVGILQAVAKANMFKRLLVEREGEKVLWAQPEDFEEAKGIWKEFAIYQMKVDYTGLRILEVLPDREPRGSLDEKAKESRPEPSDDAPTVSYLAKKLHESPRTIRDKLNNLYDAGLVDKKWWGSWNTEHYFWKMPFLTKLEEETKIRQESMSTESIRSFALAVNLEEYVEKYLERLQRSPQIPPQPQFQNSPQSTRTILEMSDLKTGLKQEKGSSNIGNSIQKAVCYTCHVKKYQPMIRTGHAKFLRSLTKEERSTGVRCQDCGNPADMEIEV